MTNKLKKLVQNGTEYEIPSYESKTAASGGTDLSLVTTGEKYTRNNKLDSGNISDTAYASSWNGVTTIAPSKNAVYDKISSMDTTISGKQDALSTQTAYSSKGTATKVPTITTNTLGQVTAISETNIAFPVTSVNGQTGAVTVSEFSPSGTATTGYVVRKTANGYNWDEVATVMTASEYSQVSSPVAGKIYFIKAS